MGIKLGMGVGLDAKVGMGVRYLVLACEDAVGVALSFSRSSVAASTQARSTDSARPTQDHRIQLFHLSRATFTGSPLAVGIQLSCTSRRFPEREPQGGAIGRRNPSCVLTSTALYPSDSCKSREKDKARGACVSNEIAPMPKGWFLCYDEDTLSIQEPQSTGVRENRLTVIAAVSYPID